MTSFDNRRNRRRITRRLELLEDRRVLAAVNFVAQPPIVAPDHVWATSAVPSDIDDDGDLDLVTSSALDNRVGWYENDGRGSFGPLRLVSDEAEESRMVRTADLDGDGDLDILSANYLSDTVKWFENLDGKGEFGPANVITEFAIDATAVDTADIDGDGDLDLISTSAGDYDSDVSWYRNDGDGNFGVQTIITSDVLKPYSAVTADVDGDGDPDVLSASLDDDKLAWYENTDGLGTFSQQKIISDTFAEPNEIIAADIDGDGDLDVIAGQYTDYGTNDRVSWFANDGQGNFGDEQQITNLTVGVESLQAIDLDGDTDLDLVSASFLDDKVAWYENLDGKGRFGGQRLITDEGSSATSAIAGDLDADGDLDLALSSFFDNTISWVQNNGNGRFSERIILSQFGPEGIEEVRAADIDGDGDLDALSASVGDSTFAWYENLDGEGNFGPQQAIDSSASVAANFEVADLDDDGDLDVIGTSLADSTIGWYENVDGKGSFSARSVIENRYLSEVVRVADLDGDLDLDVIAAVTDPGNSAVVWYENQGSGQFGGDQPIWDNLDSEDPFDRPRDLETADIDNDGDEDIVVATIFDDTISWFENTDGKGMFGPQQMIAEAEGLWAIDVDDIDGNGFPDVLVARIDDGGLADDDVVSWHANSDGSFSPEQIISDGVQEFPEDMDMADFDGDGDVDVVVGSFADDKFSWYENLDGLGSFGEEQVIEDDAPRASAVVAADIDNDGKVDLLTAALLLDRVTWYRNESDQPLRGDFTGDGKLTADDVDLLCGQIRSGDHVAEYDLTADTLVDSQDLEEMIFRVLDTTIGDANLDGTFDSSDLVNVFRAGEYEDATEGNSTWAEGDWNCDGEFDTSDLVAAFRAGGYSAGARGVDRADLAAAVDWMFRQDDE